MCLRHKILHCEEDIESSSDIVHLDECSVMDINHRVWSGRALSEVHNGLGFKLSKNFLHELIAPKIPLPKEQPISEALLDCFAPFFDT
jgi:hypothetical protein